MVRTASRMASGSDSHASMTTVNSGSISVESGKQAGKTGLAEVVSVVESTGCGTDTLGFKPSEASEKGLGGFDSHPLPLCSTKRL